MFLARIDLLVALRQQRADGIARSGPVVDGDAAACGNARLADGVVVDQHVRHVLGVQAIEMGVGGGIGHRQDQAVDALLQQGLDGTGFALKVVSGGHQHDTLARDGRRVFNALHALGKHRVGQRGQHHAQQPRMHRAQLAAQCVGAVLQRIHGGLHAGERLGAHTLRRIDGTRHGGDGDARPCCHVLDAACHGALV